MKPARTVSVDGVRPGLLVKRWLALALEFDLAADILRMLTAKLGFLLRVGLGYLTLDRPLLVRRAAEMVALGMMVLTGGMTYSERRPRWPG